MEIINRVKNQKGVTNVLVIISMVVILGFTALVVDIGLILLERNKLENAADAAALAGAQELPTNPNKAIEKAKEYAVINGADLAKTSIVIKENNSRIQVNIDNDVDFIFAKVLGNDKTNVVAGSAAIVGPVKEVYDGIRPFVIEDQTLTYGQRVVLKEGAGEGDNGNYGPVSLGGNGANVYRNNIKYGYNGKLRVGDIIYTEPGNMSGPTIQGVEYITERDHSTFCNYSKDSLRIFTVPVVDSLDVNGRKPVTIVGFAVFFLEDADKKGGKTEIAGRFIEFTTNGEIDMDQDDYGLKGMKLIK